MHAYAPSPVRRGANKEETAVLPAINRHQPAIIIDTRCPHNESIYTDVDRYAILSPVRLSRDYATAANLHPPASCLFLLSSCANSILRVLLSLSLFPLRSEIIYATFPNCFLAPFRTRGETSIDNVEYSILAIEQTHPRSENTIRKIPHPSIVRLRMRKKKEKKEGSKNLNERD